MPLHNVMESESKPPTPAAKSILGQRIVGDAFIQLTSYGKEAILYQVSLLADCKAEQAEQASVYVSPITLWYESCHMHFSTSSPLHEL